MVDMAGELRSRRRFLIASAGLCCNGFVLRGQDQPIFSTEVKVVNVLATVRGKHGEIIRDLTKDDFVLAENKRPQVIRYFSPETDLPLTLGLLVDTSLSQRKVIDAERGASFRFLDQVLREKLDQVFVLQFDFALQLRTTLTDSRRRLEGALEQVDIPSRQDLELQRGGGTLLYDAVVKASNEIMMNQRNRKAIIVMTDGVDTGSGADLQAATEAAQRADTLIYSILFSDEGYYGGFLGGADGRKVLQRMSQETGGGFFEVSKKQSINQIFDLIQAELRSQYNLGYVSDVPVRVSEFRGIQLTTKQKGLGVQARDKYWAKR
jgi:VWFA-related protein